MTYQGTRGSGGSGPTKSDEVSKTIVRTVEAQSVLPEGVNGRDAVASVMCVLMGRLTGGEAKNLLDALPPGFNSMLNRCAAHGGKPEGSYRDFVMEVADHLELSDATLGDRIARAVFAAVKAQLSPEVVSYVNSQIPRDLMELWRSAA